ncbi:uncharacterized protein SCHCODRAFT_02593909 [Schizophyllum commune H4-8]|uniref:uncharacterized protein n=1 Tax=Schizophyllum commune (strain H4-8 / FGSC 9210) TaxID=578458 RepID=UPI0021607621|nr:uncharacterized protein SCHCODRAFT_02593909 [Schizophyllum commune H4-8]KAI5885380.1 hypothetical protein SCHCODRAFT_02593909 [Schizophyllum commune H4-8]
MNSPQAQMARSRYGASIIQLPPSGNGATQVLPLVQTQPPPPPPRPKVERASANLKKDSVEGDKGETLTVMEQSTIVGPLVSPPLYHNQYSSAVDIARPTPALESVTVSPHPCFIDRLPTELLCVIFMMCGDPNKLFAYPRNEPSDKKAAQNKTHFYSRATIVIGHVCSRWFHITRGCPQLWTMVDMPLPQLSDVVALRLSLKYSANLPLTLRINDYHYTPEERRGTDACTALMRLVAASASRWEEISIILLGRVKLADMVQPLLEVPRTSYSCLMRAMIRFESDDDRSVTMRLWEMFYASPALRIAQWFYARINAPQIVLHHLTHIGACVIRPEKLTELLAACPNLEVLQVAVRPAPGIYPGQEDGYLFPVISPPVVLSHLRTLELSRMWDWSRVFDSVTLPRIRWLRMSGAGIQSQAISAMLRRSSARLEVLVLRRLFWGNDEEVTALLQCPELQHLKIFCYHPYEGRSNRRPPDLLDPSPYIPPAVVKYTKVYGEIEAMYDSYRF